MLALQPVPRPRPAGLFVDDNNGNWLVTSLNNLYPNMNNAARESFRAIILRPNACFPIPMSKNDAGRQLALILGEAALALLEHNDEITQRQLSEEIQAIASVASTPSRRLACEQALAESAGHSRRARSTKWM